MAMYELDVLKDRQCFREFVKQVRSAVTVRPVCRASHALRRSRVCTIAGARTSARALRELQVGPLNEAPTATLQHAVREAAGALLDPPDARPSVVPREHQQQSAPRTAAPGPSVCAPPRPLGVDWRRRGVCAPRESARAAACTSRPCDDSATDAAQPRKGQVALVVVCECAESSDKCSWQCAASLGRERRVIGLPQYQPSPPPADACASPANSAPQLECRTVNWTFERRCDSAAAPRIVESRRRATAALAAAARPRREREGESPEPLA